MTINRARFEDAMRALLEPKAKRILPDIVCPSCRGAGYIAASPATLPAVNYAARADGYKLAVPCECSPNTNAIAVVVKG